VVIRPIELLPELVNHNANADWRIRVEPADVVAALKAL
jgi:hypothetical protein